MTSIPWSSSLCHCFSGLAEVAATFSHQHLYEIHQKSSFSYRCQWFIQNEQERQFQAAQARWKAQMEQAVTQAFRACFKTPEQQQAENVAKEQQAEQARLAKEAEEARIKKERLEAFACRRCPAKFPSNTKLHEHIRNHHAKKPKTAPTSSTPPTPPALPIPFAASSMPPQMPPTPPLTPPAFPATPPSTPKKAYLTMNDLFARFTGKPMPLGLLHRPRNPFSPLDRQPSHRTPPTSQQTRITAYFLPVTPKKNRNKLDPNRQSSSAAGKLIGVGRFGPKRAFPPSSIPSWISRIRGHSPWTFYHPNAWQEHHAHRHKSWRALG